MRSPPEENASAQPENHGQDSSIGALESAERHIARSTDTSSSCDGSGKAFSTTFSSLIDWAEERSLIRKQSDFEFFARPTDGHGDEHEAWYDATSNRWFKAHISTDLALLGASGETRQRSTSTCCVYCFKICTSVTKYDLSLSLTTKRECGC
jgi:hypothetical protein